MSAATISGTVSIAHTVAAVAPDFFRAAPPGIAFKDCFVRVTRSSLHCEPLSPEHRARHRYDFDFDGVGLPTAFFRFLDDLTKNDVDRAAKIAAIQEFMGAAISGMATRYERALLLFGPGGNGKTRLAQIITATMPEGSVTGVAPMYWRDQYQLPRLNGPRLNIVPDCTDDDLGPIIKSVISGEMLSARDPGAKAIVFCPIAAHAFGANKLPRTIDTSDGFFRRWIIVTLTRRFRDEPICDPHIVDKIVPHELPGIVRWSLEGAVRLYGQTDYTLPVCHSLALGRWRKRDDSVRVFVDTETRAATSNERGELASVLHQAYATWVARFADTSAVGQIEFSKRLSEAGYPGAHSSEGARYAIRLRSTP